ncbi:hypothetical protein DFQ27_006735 [Actinomortierella ambigua]|uniref:Protein kinase domain-containing protein n=1 Tax=Actinomortierella ambigua TaxID=1343610 RepID=A0A9P6PWQ1_9FUNG|nr:hypothetical protein DFQ27_006735 [Actinomortierella ambigua]
MSGEHPGELIGRGAYGSVYRTTWEGRTVAIKVFDMNPASDPVNKAIQREIDLLANLRDRHIIQFYGTPNHKGRLALAMEYAEGGSLQQVIENCCLNWSERERISQEMVRGLRFIHYKNVIHRDLKSMNVLLTRNRTAKLADFGLATIKAHSASTSTGIKGTIRWMAPELFGARPKYSFKSDMYALGMVMWEMAANCTTPFREQSNNMAIGNTVVGGERETLPADTPLEYRSWVERCWHQEPDQRPEASEMVKEDDAHASMDETRHGQNTVSVTQDSSCPSVTPSSLGGNAAKKSEETISLSPGDVKEIQTRAQGGDWEAQMTLASMYEMGVNVDQDDTKAFQWYLRAAEGCREARYKCGTFLRHGRGTEMNYDAALYWIWPAAHEGHPMAQRDLAAMCSSGHGTEQNYAEAMFWFHKSADQGDRVAQMNLGWMYQNALGAERDDGQAVYWYRRAAKRGDAAAQNNLGTMYYNGLGVEQDYVKAVSWFLKAAEQGNANAQHNLGEAYYHGHGVECAYVKAASRYLQSAQQGDAAAQNNLGLMYEDGLGVERDYGEAMTWYRKSADQEDAAAQNNIGSLYLRGLGVECSYDLAIFWYSKSAEQENPMAQSNLGLMYQNGLGVARNYTKAVSWFRKSAEQGNAVAQFNLDWMYQHGLVFGSNQGGEVSWHYKSAGQEDTDSLSLELRREEDQGDVNDIQQPNVTAGEQIADTEQPSSSDRSTALGRLLAPQQGSTLQRLSALESPSASGPPPAPGGPTPRAEPSCMSDLQSLPDL